ncbi:MAG TPA: DUF4118 domain-containing protein [Nitrospira sp.]|nr:DUF4118 domain-containing protein [Nitrospira sp.]
MIFHPTVGADVQKRWEQIDTSQCPNQSETSVETTAQRSEPPSGSIGQKKPIFPLSIERQYGIALGSTLIAFLICIIAVSYLGDTLPFMIFLVAIAVTTWCGGIGASLTVLILGALLWNWFFVNPRYAFTMGSHVDQAGMTVYLTTGIAIIGYFQTWRWAWKQSKEMTEGLHRERVRGMFSKTTHHT